MSYSDYYLKFMDEIKEKLVEILSSSVSFRQEYYNAKETMDGFEEALSERADEYVFDEEQYQMKEEDSKYEEDKIRIFVPPRVESILFYFPNIWADWKDYCKTLEPEDTTGGDGSELDESILNEGLLTSDFTFGFELEAILSADSDIVLDVKADMEEYEEDEDDFNDRVDEEIKKYFDSFIEYDDEGQLDKSVSGESRLHGDSSITPDEYEDITFEYSSPIMRATPSSFHSVIDALDNMSSNGFFTNNSCGFHHHLSFNTMTYKDLLWIYSCLACDEEAYAELYSFNGYVFADEEYASWKEIKKLEKYLLNKDFKGAAEYLTDSKYRAFRIHPQGTLEWRGPREFLNTPNLSEIKDFYKLLNYLIKKIKTYMSSNYIEGTTITKKEWEENIIQYIPEIKGNTGKVQDKSVERFLQRLLSNPQSIVKLGTNQTIKTFFEKMLAELKYTEKLPTYKEVVRILSHQIEHGFIKPDKGASIAKSIYESGKKYIDENELDYTFISLKLGRYVFTQKQINAFLDSRDSLWGYIDAAKTIWKNGFEVEEPEDHILSFLKTPMAFDCSGVTVLANIHYHYLGNDEGWGFIKPPEIAKLVYNIFLGLYTYRTKLAFRDKYGYNNAMEGAKEVFIPLVQTYLPEKLNYLEKIIADLKTRFEKSKKQDEIR